MRQRLFGLSALLMLVVGSKAARAQSAPVVMNRSLGDELMRTGVWMLIAIVLFGIAYKLADIATPGDLKTQLAEGNTAMAIFAGSLIIGFALIIAQLVS